MKAPIGKKYSVLAVCTLRAPYLSAAIGRWQRLRRHTLQRPAREKASQQARLARARRRRPARRRQRARRRPPRCTRCAALRFLAEFTSCKQLQHFHVVQPPPSSGCAHGLCTWGCAWGASRVGLVAILCVSFASPMRQGLATAMLADVLLVAAAGSLRASLLCLLHCFTFACMAGFIFALSPSSSLSLLSCLARSQRRGHLQCTSWPSREAAATQSYPGATLQSAHQPR